MLSLRPETGIMDSLARLFSSLNLGADKRGRLSWKSSLAGIGSPDRKRGWHALALDQSDCRFTCHGIGRYSVRPYCQLSNVAMVIAAGISRFEEREGSNLHFSRPKLPLKHSNRFALFHLLCNQSVCPAIVRSVGVTLLSLYNSPEPASELS